MFLSLSDNFRFFEAVVKPAVLGTAVLLSVLKSSHTRSLTAVYRQLVPCSTGIRDAFTTAS